MKSNQFKEQASSKSRIVQGFLNTHPARTVRVRIKGDSGFLTIKGMSNTSGTTRYEWEKSIDVNEAESLLTLCEEGVLEKTRYEIPMGEHIFEVDEFHGDNNGLIVVEVELNSEDEIFQKPDWLGDEVTGDIKYYNSQLSKQPYKDW